MTRQDTRNWIALAEYDLETAGHMLTTGRYLYVIFLCHLALEKMLKAHVTEVRQSMPAKTHDLIHLVKESGLMIPQGSLEFIGQINTASIPTRYPEDLQRAVRDYPDAVARDYLHRTQEVIQWLRQHPNLNQ
jgi:HEPN domain-containing protein